MSIKQDRPPVRTFEDLNRKYMFEKRFKEMNKSVSQAQRTADDAKKSYDVLNKESIGFSAKLGEIERGLEGITDFLEYSASDTDNVFLRNYPIGSIYMSVNNTSPAGLFGGTWTELTDRFLIGAGSYSAEHGVEGGEAEHTLTVDEMPAHEGHINENATSNYYLPIGSLTSSSSYGNGWKNASGEAYPAHKNAGGDKAHNNMPPYLAVYMWKRTA